MSVKTDIMVINGPNLNMLGKREPDLYGRQSLADIEESALARAAQHGLSLAWHQSNHEGEIIDWLQAARNETRAVILNAAGYTHSSVAIRDAFLLFEGPRLEVHLSNIYQREEFRHHSYLSDVATGIIAGFGATSYLLAIEAVADLLQDTP